MSLQKSDAAKIGERNHVRRAAGLPAIGVEHELHRIKVASDDAGFEKFFQHHAHSFRSMWSDSRRAG